MSQFDLLPGPDFRKADAEPPLSFGPPGVNYRRVFLKDGKGDEVGFTDLSLVKSNQTDFQATGLMGGRTAEKLLNNGTLAVKGLLVYRVEGRLHFNLYQGTFIYINPEGVRCPDCREELECNDACSTPFCTTCELGLPGPPFPLTRFPTGISQLTNFLEEA